MFACYQVPLGQLKCTLKFYEKHKNKIICQLIQFFAWNIYCLQNKFALKSQTHLNGLLYSRQMTNIRCIYLQQDLQLTEQAYFYCPFCTLKNCGTIVWMHKSIASLIQWGQIQFEIAFSFHKYIIQSRSMKSLLGRYFKIIGKYLVKF